MERLDPGDRSWLGTLLEGAEQRPPLPGLSRADAASIFSYVNNPDGTLRWLFRSGIGFPAHLALYNAATSRGRMYQAGVKWLFRCGLERMVVSGRLNTPFSERDLLGRWLEDPGRFDHVAFFSGTRGEDRKVVVALGNHRRITHFLKIPLSDRSRALIHGESAALERVRPHVPADVTIPEVVASAGKNGACLMTSVRPETPRRAHDLEEVHLGFLHALYSRLSTPRLIGETAFYLQARKRIENLPRTLPQGNRLPASQVSQLLSLLRRTLARIPAETEAPFSFSHGDFTPWNSFIDDRRLCVYDWELSGDAPLLDDAFHFVCHGGVLAGRLSPPAILARVQRMVRSPVVQRVAGEFRIRPGLHFRLYLLGKVSYALDSYLRRSDLHPQSEWLLEFWAKALAHAEQDPG